MVLFKAAMIAILAFVAGCQFTNMWHYGLAFDERLIGLLMCLGLVVVYFVELARGS